MLNEDQNAGGSSEHVVSDNVQKSKDHVAYSTYSKVLSEKKRRDNEIAELRSQLDSIENAKLEAEGKKDEVIAKLRTQLDEVTNKSKLDKQGWVKSSITNQLGIEATKRGCTDVNVLMRLLDSETLQGVEVDENYRMQGEDVSRIIDEMASKTEHIGLFKATKVNHNPSNPSYKPAEPKPIDQMTKEEIEAELKRLG